MKKYSINVYYSDLSVFPNLKRVMGWDWQRNNIVRYASNFMEVGLEGEYQNPYKIADELTEVTSLR